MNRMIESIPSANILLSSLRSVGYTPETAIADIVDNSLSANASAVNIEIDWCDQRIIISDNGDGMSNQELIKSMSIGSSDPLNERSIHDLGRFGMGMKTASFSLGKKLTVITKNKDGISNACWDLDYVRDNDRWEILAEDSSNELICDLSERLSNYRNGTVVCISNIDKVISSTSSAEKKKFYKMIDNIKYHLSLVFHRFMEAGKVSVTVNHTLLVPWNPFIPQNNARQELESEEVVENGHKVIIKPYVLPHKTKFANDDEVTAAGGYKGWLQHQGFYVYRNERLFLLHILMILFVLQLRKQLSSRSKCIIREEHIQIQITGEMRMFLN